METHHERIEKIASWIYGASHFVVFTGAGISTESGIPDFRGPNGVWTRRDKGLPPPKLKKPRSQIKPNTGHLIIKQFQDWGILVHLISQNVDSLHLASGIDPNKISELHGNSTLMRCLECDRQFPKIGFWDENRWGKGYRTQTVQEGQPVCPECKGRLISSVVNFGDPMPRKELKEAIEHSKQADVFLVVGSSLSVAPASHMPAYAVKAGSKLIIINHQPTELDSLAHLRFYEDAGQILSDIQQKLKMYFTKGSV